MPDYIRREAAIEALCKAHSPYPRRREISVRAIREIPAADVRPVVRAEWLEPDDDYGYLVCSNCEERSPNDERWDYCPYCGADMRKVVEIDQVKEGEE